jgi:glycosyltransferase involved in cell wall biosynthesis
MTDHRLKIGIDARASSHPQPGGFKTYVKSLIGGLAAVEPEHDFRLYVDRVCADAIPAGVRRFHHEVVTARPALVGPVVREQLALPTCAALDRLDVVHFPTGTAPLWTLSPVVLTIHDAIEQTAPPEQRAAEVGTKRRLMSLYNRYCQRLVARRADLVLTVSQCSRRDISSVLGVPAENIRVIHEAPGPQFRPTPGGGWAVGAGEPFILAIGSADPRKNLASLIRAYAQLPAELIERHRLVLVWSHRSLQDRLLSLARELGVADRITSVHAPTDLQLCQLYSAASVFVFPSLYEGFGLPPIEAMACGAPVVASNTSSLPEVLGDAALLVDPTSAAGLARAIAAVLTNPALLEDLRRRGLARAAQFSWEQTARQTLAAYEHVVAAGAERRRAARLASGETR